MSKCRDFFWLISILAIHTGLLLYSSLVQSPTVGEVGHMAAGVSHWSLGNFALFRVNPPLIRLIATLPVVAASPNKDWHSASTDLTIRSELVVGEDFIVANQDCAKRLFIMARWVCVPLSLLGACICSQWAGQLYGRASAYLALLLWCFCPAILAFAPMLGPDMGSAAIGVAAAYVFWKWLKKPSWQMTVVAGVVLGLAELTKFTWIVLFLLWPVVWLIWKSSRASKNGRAEAVKDKGRQWWRYWACSGLQLCLILLLAVYTINLGYGFEGTLERLGEYIFASKSLTDLPSDAETSTPMQNRFIGTWCARIPVPFPKNYIMGIDRQKLDFERGLPSYLRGEWRNHGWWYYYLYALGVKEPLGTWWLVLLAGMATFLRRQSYSASWCDEIVLLAPMLVILVFVSSQTGFSVHSRYIIPALPFLFVWASKVGRVFEVRPFTRTRLVMAITIVLAIIWSIGSSLSAYPHSLSYFNELAVFLPTPADATYPTPTSKSDENILSSVISAGPRNGPRHLLDSNIDWGQDLFYLKNWLAEHPNAKLEGLAVWGSCPTTLAGIPETPMPPTESGIGPKPGWYALSVNYIYSRDRQYRYFLNFQPVAMAGYSIYIYHITLDEANRVRKKLGLPELKERKANAQECVVQQ